MSIRDRLLYLIGLRPTPDPRTYHLDLSDSLQTSLSTIARDEGRPEHDLIPELLNAGLTQYTSNERLWKKWESLSPREKDVAALVCLGYTNKEIGGRLNISPQTVKTHLRNVLIKFNFRTRFELKLNLQGWDFSYWE